MVGFRRLQGYPQEDHVDLSTLLGRLQSGDWTLTDADLAPVLELATGAVTASSCPYDIMEQFPSFSQDKAEKVAAYVNKYQVHSCTSSCATSIPTGQLCRHFFPRMPSFFHIIARCPNTWLEESRVELSIVENFHMCVQEELRNVENRAQLEEFDTPEGLVRLLTRAAGGTPTEKEGVPGAYSWASMTVTPSNELHEQMEAWSQRLPMNQPYALVLALYHNSLHTRRHAKFIPRRKASECYIETYNPYVLLTADSNISVDLITHTVTRLFSYVTKGGGGRTGIKDATMELLDRHETEALAVAEQMATRFDGWREVSLGEALYRLNPSMQLASSNFSVFFINTKLPEDRRFYYNNYEDDMTAEDSQEEDEEDEGQSDHYTRYSRRLV
jgi:hypothetical protein